MGEKAITEGGHIEGLCSHRNGGMLLCHSLNELKGSEENLKEKNVCK